MSDRPQPESRLAHPRYLTVPPPGGWVGYMKREPPVESPFHLEFDRGTVLLSGRRSPPSLEMLLRYVQARGVFYVDLEGTAP